MYRMPREFARSAAAPVGRSRVRARCLPHDQSGRECPISLPRDALRGHMAKWHAFRAVCRDWVLYSGADVFGKVPGEVAAGVVADPFRRRRSQVDVAVLARTGRERPSSGYVATSCLP